MKNALFTLALAAASFGAVAQSKTGSLAPATTPAPSAAPAAPADAYTTMMQTTIAEQNAATTPAALQATLAKLERAAAAAPTAWEPPYYQARAYLKMGFAGADDDQKDLAFDRAQAALDRAKKCPTANAAEVLVLQAYIYQGRIMVSPMSRGMVYTGRVNEALEAAKKLDPQNPRVYLLLANDLYFRPAIFGGGADKAKPLYEKAQALFTIFKPATPLSPTWGEKNVTSVLANINGEAATAKK